MFLFFLFFSSTFIFFFFFFSSRRRHTRFSRDWSSDVCSSDLRRRRRDAADGLRVRTQENPHVRHARGLLQPARRARAPRREAVSEALGDRLCLTGRSPPSSRS